MPDRPNRTSGRTRSRALLRVEALEPRETPAAAGSPDPSFGGGGVSDVTASGAGQAVAVDSHGRVIVAGGILGAGGALDFLVARLNADGTPDSAFGSGGRQLIDFGGDDIAYGVALDQAGNVVVAGSSVGAGQRAVLARLTPAGVLDPAFGTGGRVVITTPNDLFAYAVATDPAGRVVAAGGSFNPASPGANVFRLLPDGTPDPAFNGGAVKFIPFGWDNSTARAVALDAAGNVVVGADVTTGLTEHKMGVARLTPAGALDATFGSGGTFTFHATTRTGDSTRGIALDAAGRVYLAGFARGIDNWLTVARLTPAGALDGSFGSGGVYAETRADSFASAVAVRPDGRVVVGGTVGGSFSGFAVLRLTAGGVPDPSFAPFGSLAGVAPVPGTGGLPPPGAGGVFVKGMALAPDGRVVVVGDPGVAGRVVAARLLGDPAPTRHRTFAAGGAPDGKAVVYAPDVSTGVYTRTVTVGPFAENVEVRTAVADVDGDGFEDTVVVTGPGTPIRVTVVSGADDTAVLVAAFDPFGGNFQGGGYAAAGDLDGDGRAEFVITPDQGGGPRVMVFSLLGGSPAVRADFFGIDDPAFRGGCRAALGDVQANGSQAVVVAAGFGGGPRVAVYAGGSVLSGAPIRLVNDFFAFPGPDAATLRNGVFVAAGDVNGDGNADLVFGAGPGGAPRMLVLNGLSVAAPGANLGAGGGLLANFYVAGDSADRGGVRVAATHADADLRAELVAGSGGGNPARVRVYLGKNLIDAGEPGTFQDIDPFGGQALLGGVFVG